MAEDFEAGINSWWNTARTSSSSSGTGSGFDGSPAMAAASISCSASIADSGIIDQPLSGPLVDSSLQISGFNMDWNQSLIRSSTSGRAEPSFHAMLQEPLDYTPIEYGHHHQVHVGSHDTSNQQFSLDHHQQQQLQQQQPGFPVLLQGLFEPETKSQQPVFDQRSSLNYQQTQSLDMMGTSSYEASSNDSLTQFSQFLRSSPPKHQQQQQLSSTSANQLQFTNTAAFWNASATTYPSASMPIQFTPQSFDQKPSCSSLTTKSNSEAGSKKSGSGSSSSNSEPALKKTRVETPSPLPTFKVRKEKLGDRITALQQLVSPFGKTDTASVLHEAIDYIKFLHDQVSVLSTPYLKNGHPMQHQQSSGKSKEGEGPKQDLRSRGLCLVPVESTYPVASETTADFWTPTFGGTYR